MWITPTLEAETDVTGDGSQVRSCRDGPGNPRRTDRAREACRGASSAPALERGAGFRLSLAFPLSDPCGRARRAFPGLALLRAAAVKSSDSSSPQRLASARESSAAASGADDAAPAADADAEPGRSRVRGVEGRIRHLFTTRSRRLLLQTALPWGAALLVGLVSVLYARWSTDVYDLFVRWIAHRWWLAFVLTPTLTVSAVFLTRRWFYGSEGSGIPQVIAAIHAPRAADDRLMQRLFGLRVIFGKLGGSLLGFLGGLSIGREGPTVHIGAAIMAETRRFYPHRSVRLERQLLLAGAAAGLSGAFNTPLAGVIFAIEEIARDFQSRTNGTMITAVVFSGLTSLALAGNYLYFGQLNVPQTLHLSFVMPVVVAAVICGLLGAAFNLALLRWTAWMPHPMRRLKIDRPLWYAFASGIVIAAIGLATRGQTWGSGYDQARALLHGRAPLSEAFGFTKWVSLIVTYLAGLPGGLFSPSLSIGAGIAQWVHALFSWTSMAEVIALCMTGYLAAVTQSPITSFVIVMEMTNGTGMVIPMMATALVAARIASFFTPPLYEALAAQKYFNYEPPPEARVERTGQRPAAAA
jgi:H+/Cl- antiporter ClcA